MQNTKIHAKDIECIISQSYFPMQSKGVKIKEIPPPPLPHSTSHHVSALSPKIKQFCKKPNKIEIVGCKYPSVQQTQKHSTFRSTYS